MILVGHSYGGMVITGVADRAADRVGQLVYLDAANPVNGQSLVDVAGPHHLTARDRWARCVDGVELVLLPAPGAAAFYGVTDPDDLAWMDERLTAHPWACFEQKLGSPTRTRCGRSRSTTSSARRRFATRDPELMAEARAAGRLWDDRHRPRPDDHRARLRDERSRRDRRTRRMSDRDETLDAARAMRRRHPGRRVRRCAGR